MLCFDFQSCHIEDEDNDTDEDQEVESFEVSYFGLSQKRNIKCLPTLLTYSDFTYEITYLSDVPQEKEVMKQKLLYQQARLHSRGASEMVLQTISVSRGIKKKSIHLLPGEES